MVFPQRPADQAWAESARSSKGACSLAQGDNPLLGSAAAAMNCAQLHHATACTSSGRGTGSRVMRQASTGQNSFSSTDPSDAR